MFGFDKTGNLKRRPAPDIRLDRTGRRADLYHRRDKRIDEEMQDMSNDLISREYITDKICGLYSDGEKANNKDKVINEVIDIIDHAPTVDIKDQIAGAYNEGYMCGNKEEKARAQGEWISVSERLPDKNMPCLVSVGKFNFTQIAMYSDLMETIDHKIFYQGDYGKNNFQNITEYVKAWQPLPEPYKKGGTENDT